MNQSQSQSPGALGARLRDARRARNITQVEAAEEIGVSRPTLIAVEQGRRQPQPDELLVLARLYGRQVHELVRDSPPVEPLATRFRRAGQDPDNVASLVVEQVQRLAEDVVELEHLLGASALGRWPEQYDVEGLSVDVAAEQVASAERRRLGLGDGPLAHLREVLEDEVGLRVFYVEMPSAVAGLFTVAEPAGGCVAINARHPYERQRWTLAHEYLHFLLHRFASEVTSLESGKSRDERLAEAFAATFLMPAEGLTRRFQAARRSRNSDFTAADLLRLAALYEVSAQAMALRLEGLRLVAGGWWESLVARGLKVRDAQSLIGLPRMPPDEAALPRRTQYLAVEAFLAGVLSEGRLARLMRVDRVTARQRVERLSVSTDVAGGGDTRGWSLEGLDPG